MKILVAPTAYKGSFSPAQVAGAIADGIKSVRPDARIEVKPMADGGDGSAEVLQTHLGGDLKSIEVHNAIGHLCKAHFLAIGQNTAVLELSGICGIGDLAVNLAPLRASTFGLGEALLNCVERKFTNILIALGGSASTDGAMGALHALGAEFYDHDGAVLSPSGEALNAISKIDLAKLKKFEHLKLELLVDVSNSLLGESGAAAIFGPQKGANPEQVLILDQGLTNFANKLERLCERQCRLERGAGAAGGTAFGLACALGAQITGGAHRIAELIDLSPSIQGADLVITGEGRLDHQSWMGKATGFVAHLARTEAKTCWAICGAIATRHTLQNGVQRAESARLDGQASLADIASTAATMLRTQYG